MKHWINYTILGGLLALSLYQNVNQPAVILHSQSLGGYLLVRNMPTNMQLYYSEDGKHYHILDHAVPKNWKWRQAVRMDSNR